jgi:hypothetical protein
MPQTLADRPTAVAAPPLASPADALLGALIFAAVATGTGWFLLRMTGSSLGALLIPGLILLAATLVVATPRRLRLGALAVAFLAVPAALPLLT